MSDGKLQAINEQLQRNGLRTVQEFEAGAMALITYSGGTEVLEGHLKNWEENDYDPSLLQLNILTILKFKRREMSARQYRCDSSTERIKKIIAEIKAHETADYVDHLEKILDADALIQWCASFSELSAVPQPS